MDRTILYVQRICLQMHKKFILINQSNRTRLLPIIDEKGQFEILRALYWRLHIEWKKNVDFRKQIKNEIRCREYNIWKK